MQLFLTLWHTYLLKIKNIKKFFELKKPEPKFHDLFRQATQCPGKPMETGSNHMHKLNKQTVEHWMS